MAVDPLTAKILAKVAVQAATDSESRKRILFMILVNCTPFVRQYDILSKKWGVLLCQKEYQTNDIRRSSREWL